MKIGLFFQLYNKGNYLTACSLDNHALFFLCVFFIILHTLKYYMIDTYRTDVIPGTRNYINTV